MTRPDWHDRLAAVQTPVASDEQIALLRTYLTPEALRRSDAQAMFAVLNELERYRSTLPDISAALACIAGMEADAARYRYLKQDRNPNAGSVWIARGHVGCLSRWTGETADQLIDAAMALPLPPVTETKT